MNREHIRIETVATDPVGHPRLGSHQRFIFVAYDGRETDISRIFSGVAVDMWAGDPLMATFKTPFIRLVEVEA
ncbi:MAG: hypothetical protein H0W31_00060 [Actinobacteria bacterium]|nr:hypothetical protein [Actinomycetota bacterium]